MSLVTAPADIVARAEASGRPGLLARRPNWPRVPLGSLVKIANGAPFSSRLFNTTGAGMPLIRIRDVGTTRATTYYDGPFDASMLVRSGDLLVGMDGDFRLARWTGPQALLNQRVCRLDITSESLESGWLFQVLPGYLDAIWAETSSVTVKHLSSRSLAQVPIPLPPVVEQRRIVDLLEDHLSRLDAAKSDLVRAIGQARLLESSLREQALDVGPGTSMMSLADLAIDARYGTSTKCIRGGPGPAVVRIPNLVGAQIDLSDEKRVADPNEDVAAMSLAEGDLLIVRTNGSRDLIGRTAVVQAGIDASFASYLIRFRLERSKVLPRWVHLALGTPGARAQLEGLAASSAGQYNLSLKKLETVRIRVPSLDQQAARLRRFEGSRDGVLRLAGMVDKAGARRSALRRRLLSAAFAGQL